MSLKHLDEHDKETCLKLLETADLGTLWDNFLSVQTKLYFTQEADLVVVEPIKGWNKCSRALPASPGRYRKSRYR